MDTLEQGSGKLFTDPSTIAARADFRQKSRAMTDKVMPVADAVRELLSDGDYLAIGGFGGDRIPTAVLHEILRQNRQNLGFAGHTSTHDFQIICAGNLTGRGQMLARADCAYVLGLEARGLSRQARRVMESGEVDWCVCFEPGLSTPVMTGVAYSPFSLRAGDGPDALAWPSLVRTTSRSLTEEAPNFVLHYSAAAAEAARCRPGRQGSGVHRDRCGCGGSGRRCRRWHLPRWPATTTLQSQASATGPWTMNDRARTNPARPRFVRCRD